MVHHGPKYYDVAGVPLCCCLKLLIYRVFPTGIDAMNCPRAAVTPPSYAPTMHALPNPSLFSHLLWSVTPPSSSASQVGVRAALNPAPAVAQRPQTFAHVSPNQQQAPTVTGAGEQDGHRHHLSESQVTQKAHLTGPVFCSSEPPASHSGLSTPVAGNRTRQSPSSAFPDRSLSRSTTKPPTSARRD